MANLVEFLVKIRDLGSGPMMQFARNTEGAFNRIGAKMKSVGSSIDQLNAKIDELTKTRDISINARQIKAVNAEIEALEKKRDRLENSGRSGKMGMLAKGMLMSGLFGAIALGKRSLQDGMERQMNQTSFEVLLGKPQGDAINGQLLKFAKDSIYGNEVFSEGKLLAGSGVKGQNIMPIMSMIGDIAMGDKERMKSIALAFSEASSTGKLTGRQEMMFRTALFNPLVQLSEMTHKPVAQIEKDMAKGKISIDKLVGAMQYATGPAGRWHDMMKKMQDTPAGKWTAFTGTLTTLSGTIGLKLLPVLGKLTDFMQSLISNSPMLYDVGAAIGAMTAAWMLYTTWVNRAAIGSAIAEAATFWPIALIGVLAAAWMDLQKYNTALDKAQARTAEIASGSFGHVYTFGEKLKWLFQDIFYWIEVAMLRFSIFMEKMDNFTKQKTLLGSVISLFHETKSGQQLADLQRKHQWDVINREAGTDDSSGGGLLKTLLGGGNGYKFGGAGVVPAGAEDTAKGITGGGVRNLTINIAKQGIDQITLHVANFREGKEEIKREFIEMFNQVVNSGNAAVNPN